jgi:hypothetical protein
MEKVGVLSCPPGLLGIRVFIFLLSPDGFCFPFFLSLQIYVKSLGFNSEDDKASAAVVYPESIVLVNLSPFMHG